MSEIKIFKNKAYTQVSATGGERELDFGFPLFSSAHIKVEEVQTDGTVKELVLETDYTVQGVGQQTGGTITLTTASYPNGALQGYTYNLIQNVPEERTSDFQQSGDFLADTLNTELDLMTQQIQQLRRDVDQAVDLPLGDDPAQFLENFYEDVQEAASSAALSRTWAIGSDEEIPETGEHSSKGNAGLAFAIANADEDVPIPDFGMPAAVVIKGEKGDPGPQLEECLNAIEAAGNAVLSDIDTAQAKADASLSTIKANKDLVLDTAAEVLAYKEAAAVSATNAAASEALANDFANADEDVIVAVI